MKRCGENEFFHCQTLISLDKILYFKSWQTGKLDWKLSFSGLFFFFFAVNRKCHHKTPRLYDHLLFVGIFVNYCYQWSLFVRRLARETFPCSSCFVFSCNRTEQSTWTSSSCSSIGQIIETDKHWNLLSVVGECVGVTDRAGLR